MDAYEVDIDFRRKMIVMILRGFWNSATFEAFAAEFTSALRLLHRHGGCAAALVDGRDFAVQSQDILEKFSNVMRDNASLLARRTANIVPPELNRMQAARVGENLTRRDFTNREEAEAWLFPAAN